MYLHSRTVTPLLRCDSSKSLLHVPSDQHKMNSTVTSGNSSASKSHVSSGNLSGHSSPMALCLILHFLPYANASCIQRLKGAWGRFLELSSISPLPLQNSALNFQLPQSPWTPICSLNSRRPLCFAWDFPACTSQEQPVVRKTR